MQKNLFTRFLAMVLTVCLALGNLAPMTVLATEAEPQGTVPAGDTSTGEAASTDETEGSTDSTQSTNVPETTNAVDGNPVAEINEEGTEKEEPSVKDYATFVANLNVLEGYASSYSTTSGKSAGELVLNFIRTGVERYRDGNWNTLAGEEITGFTTYVENQDAANGTTAMILRNIELFNIPNGQQVDFGHMFGTMNIAYVSAQATADLGGWAGDICDLMLYSKDYGNVPEGTVDEMAAFIKTNCFGVDADDAFGMDDFYGDMDAFYLVTQLKAGKTLSTVMEAYFTESQTDRDRAEYFLKNRFEGLYTQESVRTAIYDTYAANIGLQVLESSRGLTNDTELRIASCYAFADYLYELAGDTLEEPGEEKPTEPSEPATTDPSEPEEPETGNNYYSVFSSTSSTLAPGITQTINYANTKDNKQIVYYIATVDVTRDDVTIMANYHDADPSKGWAMQRVTDQVEALVAKHTNPEDPDNYIENFRAIVSTNADGFNMSTGQPGGLLVMGGVEWHPVDGDGFFAILKDGTAMIGTQADYAIYKDQIQEAVGGFGAVLIRNGEIQITQTTNYYNSRASRTAIGITADGKVVMMVMDGRQEPFSAGGSMIEIAQVMLDAGCVEAINLDGGGSSTFAAKPEGSDSVVVVNRPSDGFQRSVSTSLVAVSTAETSNEFSYATVSTEYDYLTVGTSLTLKTVGVSLSGNAAEVPADAFWKVSNETIGTITDGVFTATALGDVEVQLVLGETVVGRKTLHVVEPDALSIEKAVMNVVYGVPTKLPLQASYQGNPVAFNTGDVMVVLQYSNAGTVDGLNFTVVEASGYRTLLAGAALMKNFNIQAMTTLNCYKADEAVFDFNNATAGNEKFAWNREVSNSELLDNGIYQIVDTGEGMEISYVFAIDMQSIDIPEKLKSLTSMLPGGDNSAKTAWEYMLNLAERISTLTSVTIVAKFDDNLMVDCSELTISNDFFEMDSVTVDEATNTVTIKAKWIDQTAAVDPATASSVCILSGIKMWPKDGAAWDAKNQLIIENGGTVSYDVYLRASSLYSFAIIPSNQELYDLYPFVNPNDPSEKGARFSSDYAQFSDTVKLDKTNRQGWISNGGYLYYYKNNVALTGIHVVPGYEDPGNYYVYRFGEDGTSQGTVTGFYELEGDLYYAINGVRKVGWQTIFGSDGKLGYYYFMSGSGKAVDGEQVIDGYTYTFQDKILIRGQLVTDSRGTRYRWAGDWATQEWLNIDGNISYAMANGYFATGIRWMYSPEGVWSYYVLSDDGIWLQDLNGIYEWNGGTYLVKDGFAIDYPGLFEMDGYYYYITSTNVLIKDRDYWVSKPNGLMPERSYHFDAEGKMTNPYVPPVVDPEEPGTPDVPTPEVKNGIVAENGSLYYYENGNLTYAGLIKIDGYYYYVRGTGELVHGCYYWITKTNGLMAQGGYDFAEDGKMILEEEPDPTDPTDPTNPTNPTDPTDPTDPIDPTDPTEPTVKNGIVAENGSLYYYVDGKLNYAGLIYIDGYYYYVRGNGELVHGCSYWITKNNGLMASATYEFDDLGRMILEEKPDPTDPTDPTDPVKPEVKSGIVEENGSLYYYVDGKLNYGGLVYIDGYYYYVRGTGEVVHGRYYWITKTNGLMAQGGYDFAEDGKMILEVEPDTDPTDPTEPTVKNGIVAENGSLYYYVDGQLNYGGLIYLDGYYYYVRGTGEVVNNRYYWITKTNDLMKQGGYDFDEQGRMINPPV